MVLNGNKFHNQETNMKKLILILAIALVAFAARGQTATYGIDKDKTHSITTTDYTLTNTTVSWFLWNIVPQTPLTQDFQCILDSLAGNHTNVAVALYGKKFSGDSWTQIGSTSNSTAGTDTVTISNTVPNRYRFYKSEFTGTGTGTTTISSQELKIYKE